MQIQSINSMINDLLVNQKKVIETPVLLVSAETIIHAISFFKTCLHIELSDIYFPLKVNSDECVIELLNNQHIGFEIASLEELNCLKKLNIDPLHIIFGNPVKIKKHIREAYDYGIRLFACDSEIEIQKIAEFAPKSSIYFRLAVSNSSASWTLDQKFGATKNQIILLFKLAASFGLNPCGLSFHVGWNNTGVVDWVDALNTCVEIENEIKNKNFVLDFINIGGGFPAHRVNQFEHIEILANQLTPQLNLIKQKGIAVYAEPGSFLLANAGVTIASVVEVIERANGRWVFIDTGIMQGYSWIQSGLEYDLFCINKKDEQLEICLVTGPTCDSHDVFSRNVLLPKTICAGDLIGITPSGAYISSSKNYNGFNFPEQKLI